MAISSTFYLLISALLCNPFNYIVISALQDSKPLGPTTLYGIHVFFSLHMNLEGKRPENSVIQHPMAVSSDPN